MGIYRKKNYEQTKALVRRNCEIAVKRSAIFLQAEIKMELSKPGRGRFYARNKATRGMARLPHSQLTKAQVTSILAKENVRVAERKLRGRPAKMRGLRGLGVHQASAPGDPPAVDTGHLRRSIQTDASRIKERNPRMRVGTNVNYAPGLEYGTSRVKRRPYMRTTARRVRSQLAQFFSARNLLATIFQ